ncbi:MAG: Gfo/Idh/MocA family oxidoreductase [Clostridia bacterium]|nr:Gfo/Idh/MocA family oxidoreductase [Clostridia bacterium]
MKIGIIGFGSMGKTHLYSIKNIPFFFDSDIKPQAVYICNRNIEKARQASEKYDIPHYTDNEDDIIYNDEIDIVDICTPNICHYETAKKAILAGKHVYCEKPLGISYEQAQGLAQLAREKNVFCQVVFNNRFLAPIMRAKELIEEGYVGKILSVSVRYLHSSALEVDKKAGWKQDADICGGGVLYDLGSHAIDLVYHLAGEFKSIYGKSQIAFPTRLGVDGKAWQTNADEAFYILATLKNDAACTIEVSKITTGANDDLTLEIHGVEGSLRFNLMDPNFLEVYKRTRGDTTLGALSGYTKIECVNRYPYPGGVFPSVKAPVGWLRGHVGSYFSFLQAIKDKKQPSPSFDDGAVIQRYMSIAYESSKIGKEIEVC